MLGDDRHPTRSGGERDRRASAPLPASTARIVAVQGADGGAIQDLLATLARRWTADGRRIVGVVEETRPGLRKSAGGAFLRNLRTGGLYDIYQDLGPQSTACCLDASEFAEACPDILQDLSTCDAVVLSKFGKLEAERSGLLAAFTAAALLEKPVITSVSPMFADCYLAFVGQFGAIVPPDEESLHAWGRKLFSEEALPDQAATSSTMR